MSQKNTKEQYKGTIRNQDAVRGCAETITESKEEQGNARQCSRCPEAVKGYPGLCRKKQKERPHKKIKDNKIRDKMKSPRAR